MRQFVREVIALAGAAVGGYAGWTYAPIAYTRFASDFVDGREVARIMAVPVVPFLLTLVGGVVGAILGAVLFTLLAVSAAACISASRDAR
jgi:uncharacterized membrane protein required for colicin V production